MEFSATINSTASSEEGPFLIRGTAINETTTRNGISYVAEELSPSAESLRNKPILKDHINSVDSIVGRTTENVSFNDAKKAIEFEARIVDEAVQKKIKAGLINSVSIGAMVKDIEERVSEETGEVTQRIARGIDFVELSLVAVPADKNAGFAHAMVESFKLKKEEVKIKQTVQKHQVAEQRTDNMVNEASKLEKLQLEQIELQEEIAQMKVEKLKSEKESLSQVEEVVVEEVKIEDKTKGEVAPIVETSEPKIKHVIEQSKDFGGSSYSARRQ